MMKKLFLLLVIVVNSINAQNLSTDVLKNIQSNLLSSLSKIPAGNEKAYGFDSREDFKACTLGHPIRMVTLTAENTLQEQDQWRIPVKLNSSNKTLFTVQKINNAYEIVDIGGRGLANELQALENKGTIANYLLRLYSQHADFVSDASTLDDLNTVLFAPLESAQLYATSRNRNRLQPALSINELLTILK